MGSVQPSAAPAGREHELKVTFSITSPLYFPVSIRVQSTLLGIDTTVDSTFATTTSQQLGIPFTATGPGPSKVKVEVFRSGSTSKVAQGPTGGFNGPVITAPAPVTVKSLTLGKRFAPATINRETQNKLVFMDLTRADGQGIPTGEAFTIRVTSDKLTIDGPVHFLQTDPPKLTLTCHFRIGVKAGFVGPSKFLAELVYDGQVLYRTVAQGIAGPTIVGLVYGGRILQTKPMQPAQYYHDDSNTSYEIFFHVSAPLPFKGGMVEITSPDFNVQPPVLPLAFLGAIGGTRFQGFVKLSPMDAANHGPTKLVLNIWHKDEMVVSTGEEGVSGPVIMQGNRGQGRSLSY
eukprot:Platyproteum_vivax@DN3509_c0_g1_i1.p1